MVLQHAREKKIETRAEGDGLRMSELAMGIVFLADRGCVFGEQSTMSTSSRVNKECAAFWNREDALVSLTTCFRRA